MEFDALTFALEIVNFLVLLWLLERLLYRPLEAALARRAAAEAGQRAALDTRAAELAAEAEEIERRRSAEHARREAAEQELVAALAAERERRLSALATEFAGEREKARSRLERELERQLLDAERELHRRAGRYVSGYLERLAGPAVEAALIELFLADLEALPSDRLAELRDGGGACEASTAYEPDPELRERVASSLERSLGARPGWRRDPSLGAGIRVQLPGYLLEASLRRGVDAFAAEAA